MVHSLKDLHKEKEAYLYSNYGTIFNTAGAKLSILPSAYQTLFYSNPLHYSPTEIRAYAFMKDAQTSPKSSNIDAIFQQKVTNSKDSIDMLLSLIRDRNRIKYENISRIYDDLMRVDQLRNDTPYPHCYKKDSPFWAGLLNSELKLRQDLRREITTASQDLSFLSNNLSTELLSFKTEHNKQNMIGDLGGTTLDEIIGPDGSVPTIQGETYEHKPNPEKEMA